MKLSKAAGTFDYPIRVAGCLLVMMNVYIARVPELDSTHLLIWIILLLFIIYPHIAFAKFVLNPTEKTEANSLLVDMFAIGLMANLVTLTL